MSNTRILNREFQHPEDGWYQIEVLGEHRNAAAGVVQVIDAEGCAAITAAFNREAAEPRFAGMLVDHEHFRHDQDKETRAYGWLMALQNRADGVYGQIRWTGTGREAVDSGDYRFFSTEYDEADLVVLNRGQNPPRVRPTRLAGLTLTNEPNNRGGKPITNRHEDGNDFRGAGASAGSSNNNNERQNMKQVAAKLGLSADASEEAVLGELTKVLNRVTTAEAKILPLEQEVQGLRAAQERAVTEQVAGLLDAHHVTDEKVRNRMAPVLAGLANREERVAFLKDINLAPAATTGASGNGNGSGTVLNRKEASQPGAVTDGSTERERAATIRNRANELVKTGLAFDMAWAQATQENHKKS